MCRYYNEHFYPLCVHTVPAAQLPLLHCVLFEECAAQRAARAAALPPTRPLDRSNDSLEQWCARLHRSNSANTNTRPHPCFDVAFAPGTVWTVVETETAMTTTDNFDGPLDALCPTCRQALWQCNTRWRRMLDALTAASDAAGPAGTFRAAPPDQYPAVLRHLLGNARGNRRPMERARARALAQRGTHCVFRGGLWGQLALFERMVLAHFVARRARLPRWEDHETGWGLDWATQAQPMLAGLEVVLHEGERRLRQATTATTMTTTTTTWNSENSEVFFDMDM